MADNGFTRGEGSVDIAAGSGSVELIEPPVGSMARPGSGATRHGDPVLAAARERMATNVEIATEPGTHRTMGSDHVVVRVDDLMVQAARLLFFIDCFACGQLEPEIGAPVVKGLAAACAEPVSLSRTLRSRLVNSWPRHASPS